MNRIIRSDEAHMAQIVQPELAAAVVEPELTAAVSDPSLVEDDVVALDPMHLRIIEALGNTLIVGLAAVAAALVLGTLFAFHYQGSRGRGRELMQLMIFLPFLMPPILTGLSLLIFFRQAHIERSLATVVIGHTLFVLALVYRILLARLQALSPSLIEASITTSRAARIARTGAIFPW